MKMHENYKQTRPRVTSEETGWKESWALIVPEVIYILKNNRANLTRHYNFFQKWLAGCFVSITLCTLEVFSTNWKKELTELLLCANHGGRRSLCLQYHLLLKKLCKMVILQVNFIIRELNCKKVKFLNSWNIQKCLIPKNCTGTSPSYEFFLMCLWSRAWWTQNSYLSLLCFHKPHQH